MKGARGFTLVEVLLVVLLIGLAATAVTLTLPGSGIKEQLDKAARQFMAVTDMVRDEAVLSGQMLGLVIEDNSYRYVIYKDGKWQSLEQERLLAKREMEQGVSLNLIVEGLPLVQEDEEQESWFEEPLIEQSEEEKRKYPEPQIIIFPSGEMNAFELAFSARDPEAGPQESLIVADALGRLTFGRADEAQ
ncbi:type II secretion system minor pseudopilin GspH [Shewanella sedimentimangrovi]|uniref:Type II secretion system protein H n=1 Tax=Shewanella sedimentimangrovi TaxID=2814293 RepID=A0ABX7R2Y1_9GAMM|nr:type II secretion system minor pseudopilin GspH [Shewanella sedimentimangrovi]QSX37438.1 type II secretion system minor pseudopilin GspH [Shewanella sedimentimangrovi]